MNTRNFTHLKMFQVVSDLLAQNPGTTQALPGFATLFKSLQQNIELLKENMTYQSGKTDGVTYVKKKEREDLVNAALDISGKLTAYAAMAGDGLLMKNSMITRSAIARKPDHELAAYSLKLHGIALSLLSQLQPYSVTEEDLNAFKLLCDEFFQMIPKPREARDNSKQSNATLNSLIMETNSILNKLDLLVDILRKSNPGFIVKYKSARRVMGQAGKSMTVQGTVKDAETGEGIRSAEIAFKLSNGNGNGSSQPVLVKKTAAKGGFSVITLGTGAYQAIVSKMGYVQRTLPVYITEGELTRLSIDLIREKA